MLLLIDDLFAKKLEIKSTYLTIYNDFKKKNNCSFTLLDYELFSTEITRFSDELSKIIVKDMSFLPVNLKDNSKMYLVRPIVGLLSYILLDRYIRITKLLETTDINSIKTPPIEANLEFISREQLMSNVRDDEQFNQYIINKLLNKNKNFSNVKTQITKPYDLGIWDFYNGFNIKKKEKITFLKRIRNNLSKLKVFFIDCHDKYLYFMNSFRIINKFKVHKIMFSRIVYHSKYFIKNGSYKKKKENISLLPGFSLNLNKLIRKESYSKKLRQQLSINYSEEIEKLLNTLCINLKLNKCLNSEYFTKLFFYIYPISALEENKKIFEKIEKKLKYKEISIYIDGMIAGDETSSNIAAFLSNKNIPIYGIQHSGRGGYLSNCPLVSEYSILGSDYYITSGWENKETFLSLPKYKYLPLSSPAYSMFKKTHKFKNNKTILLSLGEIFRFPLIYDCTYHNDTRKEWLEFILDTLKILIQYDCKIILRSYCLSSYEVHNMLIEEIRKINSPKIIVSTDFRKGVAREYFEQVDVAAWDIPAGGFIEAMLSGLPSISLSSRKLMKFQEPSMYSIRLLEDNGFLSKTATEFANNILSALSPTWLSDQKKNYAKDLFIKDYANINKNWENEWNGFFTDICLEKK